MARKTWTCLLGISCLVVAASESVIILGAGASGIAAASRLWQSGIRDIVVLEGTSEIGGRLKSGKIGGKTVELGANWVQGDNSSNWLARLVQEYDIKCNESDWDSWLDYDNQGRTVQMPWRKKEMFLAQASRLSEDLFRDGMKNPISTEVAASMLGWRANNKYDDALMVALFDYETAAQPSRVDFAATYPIATYADFGDGECFINDQRGFKQVLKSMVSKVGFGHTIKLNQTVQRIEYARDSVTVITQDSSYHADYVIVTFSVGVLQHSIVSFSPQLPQWKTQAINAYGMEAYVKIFFEFPYKFWPDSEFFLFAGALRGYYPIWQNMNYAKQWGRQPPFVLMVTVLNSNARKLERQAKEVTISEAVEVLSSMFPNRSVPQPTQVLFHDWSSDPFSKGSYSFWPVGVSDDTKEQLCAPVGRLWFAGEACHRKYSSSVHGALMSGNSTAMKVVQCLRDRGSVLVPSSLVREKASISDANNTNGLALLVTVCVVSALCSIAAVAREMFIAMRLLTARGTAKRWLLQITCACNSLLDNVEYSFIVPMSYELSKISSSNASMSGFFIGANGIGYFVGVLFGRFLWKVLSHASVRRVIIVCPILSAMIYTAFALKLLDGQEAGLVGLILGVRLGAGVVQGTNQLIEYTVKEVTPPNEQVRLSILDYSGICLGIGIGPLFSSIVNTVFGNLIAHPIQEAVAPSLVLALFSATNAIVLSYLLPGDVEHLKIQNESADDDTVEWKRSSWERATMVILCGLVLFMATAAAASIEVATSLFLELEGGWSSQSTGFATGAVITFAAVIGLFLVALREFYMTRELTLVIVSLGFALLGSSLVFDILTASIWQMLFADFLLYPSIMILASIAEGLLFVAAASNSIFSVPNLLIVTYFADAIAKSSCTPLARYLVAVGGRNIYACELLLQIGSVAFAFFAIAWIFPGLLQSSLVFEDEAARCEQGQAQPRTSYPIVLGSENCNSNKLVQTYDPKDSDVQKNDFIMTLNCQIPDSLEIRETAYGKGIFSKIDLQAGQFIAREKFHLIKDEPGHVLLKTNIFDTVLTVATHFPLLAPGIREVNYYDCFTNHSCDANIFYDDITYTDANNGEYSTYARKDMLAGTQLTCDYDLFDWQCLDKSISCCQCRSLSCRGQIYGMKYMPFQTSLSLLAEAEPLTRTCFLQEHPYVMFQTLPVFNGIDFMQTCDGWCMVTTQDVDAGEIICEWEALTVPAFVQYVVLGLPPCIGTRRLPPRTVVFNASAIGRRSVYRQEQVFYGCAFGSRYYNAEIVCQDESFASQIRSVKAISAGSEIVCEANTGQRVRA